MFYTSSKRISFYHKCKWENSIIFYFYPLQFAVEGGLGGPHSAEKAEWMIGAVQTWFMENRKSCKCS